MGLGGVPQITFRAGVERRRRVDPIVKRARKRGRKKRDLAFFCVYYHTEKKALLKRTYRGAPNTKVRIYGFFSRIIFGEKPVLSLCVISQNEEMDPRVLMRFSRSMEGSLMEEGKKGDFFSSLFLGEMEASHLNWSGGKETFFPSPKSHYSLLLLLLLALLLFPPNEYRKEKRRRRVLS